MVCRSHWLVEANVECDSNKKVSALILAAKCPEGGLHRIIYIIPLYI